MSKKFLKSLFGLAVLSFFVFGAYLPVKAAGEEIPDDIVWGNLMSEDEAGENLKEVMNNTGLGTRDPRAIVASIISIILGLLGTIAVILILMGGFKWMTAAGNEDKVEESKKLLGAGVIGLVIILAAYGIANFVLKVLLNSTGTGQNTTGN
jgi:type IV secretory pathway VirB2 component (pilin)